MIHRTAIAIASLLYLCVNSSAQQPRTIRFATSFPPGTSLAVTANEFRLTVNERSSGAARIEMVPTSDPLALLRDGQTDLAAVPSTRLAEAKSQSLALFDLPFLFADLTQVEELQGSSVGERLLASVSNEGLLGLGFWNGGMNQVFGSHPVTNASHLRSRTIREVSTPARPAIEALGLQQVSLDFTQVYIALSTGKVDLAETSPQVFAQLPAGRGLTISEVNYRPTVVVIVANEAAWKRLPFRLQSIVAEEVQLATKKATAASLQLDRSAVETMRRAGWSYADVSPTTFAGFREAAAPGWRAVGAVTERGLLNAALGVLEEQRAGPKSTPPLNPKRPQTTIPIFFATDRTDEGGSDVRYRFGSTRGQFRYGMLRVEVGPDRLVGDIPDAGTLLGTPTVLRTESDFIISLSAGLQSAPVKDILIYVHGFCTPFARAVENAALLTVDTKFRGTAVAFSWPSESPTLCHLYPKDENEVAASRNSFIALLEAIQKTPGLRRVHIVAHSMGNRLVAEALDYLNGRPGYTSQVLFNVVLAAPDIFKVRFEQVLPSLAVLAKFVTLYASDQDKALQCARNYHGVPRAGQGGTDIVVKTGIETLDATRVDPTPNLRLPCSAGHSYVTRNPVVLGDLHAVFPGDKRPGDRFRLRSRWKDKIEYWEFH